MLASPGWQKVEKPPQGEGLLDGHVEKEKQMARACGTGSLRENRGLTRCMYLSFLSTSAPKGAEGVNRDKSLGR